MPLLPRRPAALLTAAALAATGLALTTPAAHARAGDPSIFLNEIHYDNDGTDDGEAIEIAGPIGEDLAGWQVVLYNGSGGALYESCTLSATIGDSHVVVLEYGTNGIQNGSPDGIALVNAAGEVVQFLSYEGSFMAVGGPADGVTSTDIGVAETGSTSAGFSLQLTGSGDSYADFTWTEPADDSFGSLNSGQTLSGDGGEDPPPPPPAPTATIPEIQGAAHRSPLEGKEVRDVPGIVTAVDEGAGFWFQDPAGDGDDATSDGLFVFTRFTGVEVGDEVLVDGTVEEFRPGGSTGANLTITELGRAFVEIVSSDNSVPATTVIGLGGRVPPTEIIEDDSSGDVEQSNTFDPAEDGIDFYESLEGMLVQVDDAVAVGPTNNFGEIAVLSDGGAYASVRSVRGGIVIRPDDFNPERVILDDALLARDAMPAVDVRDTFAAPLIGPLHYSFGNFKLLVTSPPVAVDGGLTRESTRSQERNELAVASFNVENLDPTDPVEQYAALARQIVDNLAAPDIITVEEIQDNDGSTNSSVVDADVTWQRLADAIVTAGGPRYDWRDIDPVDDQDGGQPGGNIRVGFLFRSDVGGLKFVDRPGGDATTSVTVEEIGRSGKAQLSVSPGRIDPNDPSFEDSRKPLAGEFKFRGETVFVVANHWNSKGGDDPLFGRFQPPVQHSRDQRNGQAAVVAGFVEDLLGVQPDAQLVVAGDLNDFEFSPPVQQLVDAGLTDLPRTLPRPERYTFIFDGNSQVLDHILLSPSLTETAYEYDIVHTNAEFADQASDHDPQVVRLPLKKR